MNSKEPGLQKVYLNADVYAVCLQHALTTEKEEIMGLLIGEVDLENSISYVSACMILHRSDKQPDRVEISPEQLYLAQAHAEKLASKLNRPMRVLGWYHSHPHITVWPSHVDTRTQAMYQTMDNMFVGLIFSVYQTDNGQTENQIQLIAFQAIPKGDNPESREIEIEIRNEMLQEYNLKGIAKFPHILIQEEVLCHENEYDNNKMHDELATLHNDALKTLNLVHIVSKVAKPMCDDYEARLKASNLRIQQLEMIKKQLLKDLNK